MDPELLRGRENLEAISFLKRCNEVAYERFPGVAMIAEESTSYPGVSHPTYNNGLGFGFKWNMGWMNDSLRYISKEPIHRRYHQSDVTFSMLYAFQEHFILVLSHDEVVHGKGSLIDKMPGDYWQKFANCRMFLSWMWAHPGKKLIFQGIEFGQFAEWKHAFSLDWHLTQSPRTTAFAAWFSTSTGYTPTSPPSTNVTIVMKGLSGSISTMPTTRSGRSCENPARGLRSFSSSMRRQSSVRIPRWRECDWILRGNPQLGFLHLWRFQCGKLRRCECL